MFSPRALSPLSAPGFLFSKTRGKLAVLTLPVAVSGEGFAALPQSAKKGLSFRFGFSLLRPSDDSLSLSRHGESQVNSFWFSDDLKPGGREQSR